MPEFRPDTIVVGAGYVGLTLALHMASKGLSLLAIDTDKNKVLELQQGKTPIYEKGIRETLKSCVRAGKLRFATSATEGAPAWILAISYFPGDTQHYLRVLDTIQGRDDKPPLILIRGTVPVGYIRSYLLPALEKQFKGPVDKAFYLVSAPERTLSGAALEELSNLPQLLGGTPESVAKAEQLFGKCGINCMPLPNLEAGELAKIFTNFARLVEFNLSNFLGVLCHQVDISEEAMIKAIMAGYPRLSSLYIPGPGVGGFCLPKDSLVLHDGLMEMEKSWEINLRDYPQQQSQLNQSVIRFHKKKVLELTSKCKSILALGIAFKGTPPTDDTRDSTGLEIVRGILEAKRGTSLHVYDLTVSQEKLKALELPLASFPILLSRYDAVLLLNNDPAYVTFLKSLITPNLSSSMTLYDPWRLVVSDQEFIFQETFPWQSLKKDSF